MRFTLIKDIKKDTTMGPILNGLLIFTLAYLILDVIVTSSTLGLFFSELTTTLFGDEEEFLDPLSEVLFLEHIHKQIFFMMMILLTLSAVFARVSNKKSYSLLLINTTMLSGLSTLITLILGYYFSTLFVHLYVVSFFLWHLGALVMTLYSLWSLNFEKSL